MTRHKPYRIKRTEDGRQFRVQVIAPNGKILSVSEPYKRRRSAYAMIQCSISMVASRLPVEKVPSQLSAFVEDLS